MVKYKRIREIILEVLLDQDWHTLDELQDECEARGLTFEGGRGPIYNVLYQLKKKEKVEAGETGEYRICKQKVEYDELTKSIENIERYVIKYKKFDWINCSDEELQNARKNVSDLLNLSREIEKEFTRSK